MTEFGLCTFPLIPGRAEPKDKAEQVTQIIFGERYKVLDRNNKWSFIENAVDSYQCWIDKKMHTGISQKDYARLGQISNKRCGDALGFVSDERGRRFAVPCSSIFTGYSEGSFEMADKKYTYDGRIARHDADSLIRHAKRLLHAPYLWGGKSALGIDCSGFVQVVFHCGGINLPRDAYQQANHGDSVDFIDLAISGDLVFFDNDDGKITHVGMITEPGKIIHASGAVRIDSIDHHGIFNAETKSYTHRTKAIKRITPLSR